MLRSLVIRWYINSAIWYQINRLICLKTHSDQKNYNKRFWRDIIYSKEEHTFGFGNKYSWNKYPFCLYKLNTILCLKTHYHAYKMIYDMSSSYKTHNRIHQFQFEDTFYSNQIHIMFSLKRNSVQMKYTYYRVWITLRARSV